MNQKELFEKRRETWHKFCIPGGSNLHKRKVNAIFLNPKNSKKHELKKCEMCLDLLRENKKFITEASECATGLRRDIVCLDTGQIYEIETSLRRGERHGKSIQVVFV